MKGYAYYTSYTNMARTIQEDAACGYVRFGDMTACGFSLAKASRNAEGCVDEFLFSARQYLETTGDKNTQVIPLDEDYQEWNNGFHARRCGEHVYVTEALPETGLNPGDELFAVGNETVMEVRKNSGQNIFGELQDEREDWDQAFRMFQTVEVFPGDGTARKVELKHIPVVKKAPELSFSRKDDKTVYMKIESLEDPEQVQQLIDSAEKDLASSDTLILDLRTCAADGDPDSFLPILPYLCDESCDAGTLFPPRTILTTYTKQNTQRRLLQLENFLAQAESEEEKAWAEAQIQDVKEKGGKVHALRASMSKLHDRRAVSEIEETEDFGMDGIRIEVKKGPSRVLILTDVSTQYAGEWLVQAVSSMKKVTVVGRPTAGMLDFTNFISVDYDDVNIRFIYPMSRTKASKEGQGVEFKGVPVDVYVPFTREECTKDLILEKAVEMV